MTTPAWLQNISDQLDEQHRQFEAPFEALINACKQRVILITIHYNVRV